MRCAVVVRDAMRGLVAFARCATRCALVAFARCRLHHAFDGGILRVRMVGGGMGGWVGGWPVCEAWVDGVMGLRVGFINILVMYNKTVGKGVV